MNEGVAFIYEKGYGEMLPRGGFCFYLLHVGMMYDLILFLFLGG